jgi:hypothetical protein
MGDLTEAHISKARFGAPGASCLSAKKLQVLRSAQDDIFIWLSQLFGGDAVA